MMQTVYHVSKSPEITPEQVALIHNSMRSQVPQRPQLRTGANDTRRRKQLAAS
jgi:hypothetical protein